MLMNLELGLMWVVSHDFPCMLERECRGIVLGTAIHWSAWLFREREERDETYEGMGLYIYIYKYR